MPDPASSIHNSSSDSSSDTFSTHSVSEHSILPPAARWLRVLVIGMGVLIAIGLAVVLTTITTRSFSDQKSSTAFRLPYGAHIQSIDFDDHHLLFHLHLPDGTQKLLILDTETGTQKTIFIETDP